MRVAAAVTMDGQRRSCAGNATAAQPRHSNRLVGVMNVKRQKPTKAATATTCRDPRGSLHDGCGCVRNAITVIWAQHTSFQSRLACASLLASMLELEW